MALLEPRGTSLSEWKCEGIGQRITSDEKDLSLKEQIISLGSDEKKCRIDVRRECLCAWQWTYYIQ